jgi:HAD superfamily hydrolase (TIGR01509 family)
MGQGHRPAVNAARYGLAVFDCDGVLIDSEMLAVEADLSCLAEEGIAVDGAEIVERYMGISFARMLADLEHRFGWTMPADFHARHWRRLAALFTARLVPIAGIEAVLDAFPGKICVASSSTPERLDLSLSLTGLHRRFAPHIFSTAMVARGKPAPDIFLHAAARMGVAPAAAVVIEDSPAGIEGAVAAGMTAIGFTGGSHCRPGHDLRLRAAGAAAVVATMAELPALLLA